MTFLMIYVLAPCIILFLAYLIFLQQTTITFYEKQGVVIYPGARKWLIGNINVLLDYQRAKFSSKVIPNAPQWISLMASEYASVAGLKGQNYEWTPTLLFQAPLQPIISISDPTIIEHLLLDKSQFYKDGITKLLFARWKDSFQNMDKCPEQMERRKAFINGFMGSAAFKNLDAIIIQVFQGWASRLKGFGSNHTFDLRAEVGHLFEQIATIFCLGKDISGTRCPLNIPDGSGKITKKPLGIFKCLPETVNFGFTAIPEKFIFGERPITKVAAACIENFNTMGNFIDGVVESYIANNPNLNMEHPKCVIDVMASSPVYNRDLKKISNDLFMAMGAAVETCQNLCVYSMTQLIKNKDIRQRVRAEIRHVMAKNNFSSAIEIGHLYATPNHFPYLHQVINECLRHKPPTYFSDMNKILKDCKLNGIQFQRNTSILFNIYGLGRNPSEWIDPEEFIPERFDPQSRYYLTPAGKPRHPNSHQPFLFGERICPGQQFGKLIIPILLIKMIDTFDFDFIDKQLYEKEHFVEASTLQSRTPPIDVTIRKRRHK